ncbi:hypothetical protein PWT90_03516 [Aphanocladium album]|nr:hypothetical protein PWT90_03516 [Aphanocladium album]
MTDPLNIGITALPLSDIAKDGPVHSRNVFENVQALMHDIRHNQAEVAACVAEFPDSVPLIYSILPTAEPGNLLMPPVQQAVALGAVCTTNESSSSDESASPQNLPYKSKIPDNAYKRAVAIADKLSLLLGSVRVLSELQHDLQHERARTHRNAPQRWRANTEPTSPSAAEAGHHSQNLEVNYRNLQPSRRFETAAKRYWCIVLAQRYRAAKQNKVRHTNSIDEKFARQYLPDEVKNGLSKKRLQEKWKAIMHQQNFWEQMATSCGGAGVLLLLPAEFHNEHARRLKTEDKVALFASIAARHPNLKHDITVLTDLLVYFFHNKVLPEWRIPLEDLPEADIATCRQRGLWELVRFDDVTSHFASDGGDAGPLPIVGPLNSRIDPNCRPDTETQRYPITLNMVEDSVEYVTGGGISDMHYHTPPRLRRKVGGEERLTKRKEGDFPPTQIFNNMPDTEYLTVKRARYTGLLDEAIKQYRDWLCSKVADPNWRHDIFAIAGLTYKGRFDLNLLCKEDVDHFVSEGFERGLATLWVAHVDEWKEQLEGED